MRWKPLFTVLLGVLMVGVTAGSATATLTPTSIWPGYPGDSSDPQHTSTLVAEGNGYMVGERYDLALSTTLGWWNGIWDPRIGMWRYDYVIGGAASARLNNGHSVSYIVANSLTIHRESPEIHFLYNPNDPIFTAVYPSPSGSHEKYKAALTLFQIALDAMEVDTGISFVMDAWSLVDSLRSLYSGDKSPDTVTYEWTWDSGVSDEAHYVRFLAYVEPGPQSYKKFTIEDFVVGFNEVYASVTWHISVKTAPAPSTLTPEELHRYSILKIPPRYLAKLKAQGIFNNAPKDINSLISYLIKEGKPLYVLTNSVRIDSG